MIPQTGGGSNLVAGWLMSPGSHCLTDTGAIREQPMTLKRYNEILIAVAGTVFALVCVGGLATSLLS